MVHHAERAGATGVKVHFYDSCNSWQRGTCKNTNGLLPQHFSKCTDLSVYSQKERDLIASH